MVMEATGRYHRKVHQCLHDRGFEVVLVNPLRARRFAEGVGHLAKTDRADALMLARLGTALGDLEPVAPQEAFLNRLEDLLVARAKHVDARTMLRQMAGEVEGDGEAITRTTMAQLDDQIAELETAIEAVIASDPEQAERYRILTSIPGVGPVTAAALLCWMPELGLHDRGFESRPSPGGSVDRGGAVRQRQRPASWRPTHPRRAPKAARCPVHGRHLGGTLQRGSHNRVRTPQGRRQGPQGRDCRSDAQTHRAGEHSAAGATLLVARSAGTTAEVSGSRPTERRRPPHGPDPR